MCTSQGQNNNFKRNFADSSKEEKIPSAEAENVICNYLDWLPPGEKCGYLIKCLEKLRCGGLFSMTKYNL